MGNKARNEQLDEQAGGIVIWGDQVVLHRTEKHNLTFPKGHIKRGETPVEAALREVEEETGLIAEAVECAGSVDFTDEEPTRRVTYFLMQVRDHSPEWSQHSGVDAFPMSIKWAESLLKHDETRMLLRRMMPRIEELARVQTAKAGARRR